MLLRFLIIFMALLYIPNSYAMCQVGETWYASSSEDCSPKTKQIKQQNTIPPSNNPICSIGYEKAYSDVKNEMRRKYPDSYSTQKMLVDSNIKSYKKLCSLTLNNVKLRVLNKQLDRYYPNFSTIEMLYNSNMKAYNELK
ncbi:hypothetical protein [Oceanisphaera profunda]|uniref:hypothetical protein n=1 Tax=Oceanisphaera profunda TaxID=1416627 RepID=UPI00125F93B2|nr:hypothetical protein [Oceanisphaera profunda]